MEQVLINVRPEIRASYSKARAFDAALRTRNCKIAKSGYVIIVESSILTQSSSVSLTLMASLHVIIDY